MFGLKTNVAWSVRDLVRLIVTSSTYRQSSVVTKEGLARDPENRLLSHMPVRRLEAEAIRDAILAVSGRLDATMHGPGVLPYLTPFMEAHASDVFEDAQPGSG